MLSDGSLQSAKSMKMVSFAYGPFTWHGPFSFFRGYGCFANGYAGSFAMLGFVWFGYGFMSFDLWYLLLLETLLMLLSIVILGGNKPTDFSFFSDEYFVKLLIKYLHVFGEFKKEI